MPRLRCVYCDLDGTLLGRQGSLLHDADGAFTHAGVRALEACARADVEVVPFSGRHRTQLFESARMLGLRSYIFEAGAGIVRDGELEWLTGDMAPAGGVSVHDQIEASGAPALLLEHYAGRLEYHAPWHAGREVSHLLRGDVDAAEADALLERHGFEHLRLVDNGPIQRRSPTLGPGPQRAFHLLPRAVSKARAVARHRQARGYEREHCIAIGDSREDLAAAAAVGTFWLVANALAKDPSLRGELARTGNVRLAEESNGAGVYEAVITTLAERRAAA